MQWAKKTISRYCPFKSGKLHHSWVPEKNELSWIGLLVSGAGRPPLAVLPAPGWRGPGQACCHQGLAHIQPDHPGKEVSQLSGLQNKSQWFSRKETRVIQEMYLDTPWMWSCMQLVQKWGKCFPDKTHKRPVYFSVEVFTCRSTTVSHLPSILQQP